MNIIDALNKGTVHFTFLKKDGTVRTAMGTRHTALIPSFNTKWVEGVESALEILNEPSLTYIAQGLDPSSTYFIKQCVGVLEGLLSDMNRDKKYRKTSDAVVTYFDFTCNSWRSFKKENFIEIFVVVDFEEK